MDDLDDVVPHALEDDSIAVGTIVIVKLVMLVILVMLVMVTNPLLIHY